MPNGWFQVAYADDVPVGASVSLDFFERSLRLTRSEHGTLSLDDLPTIERNGIVWAYHHRAGDAPTWGVPRSKKPRRRNGRRSSDARGSSARSRKRSARTRSTRRTSATCTGEDGPRGGALDRRTRETRDPARDLRHAAWTGERPASRSRLTAWGARSRASRASARRCCSISHTPIPSRSRARALLFHATEARCGRSAWPYRNGGGERDREADGRGHSDLVSTSAISNGRCYATAMDRSLLIVWWATQFYTAASV